MWLLMASDRRTVLQQLQRRRIWNQSLQRSQWMERLTLGVPLTLVQNGPAVPGHSRATVSASRFACSCFAYLWISDASGPDLCPASTGFHPTSPNHQRVLLSLWIITGWRWHGGGSPPPEGEAQLLSFPGVSPITWYGDPQRRWGSSLSTKPQRASPRQQLCDHGIPMAPLT